jgi:hypothetical protein
MRARDHAARSAGLILRNIADWPAPANLNVVTSS